MLPLDNQHGGPEDLLEKSCSSSPCWKRAEAGRRLLASLVSSQSAAFSLSCRRSGGAIPGQGAMGNATRPDPFKLAVRFAEDDRLSQLAGIRLVVHEQKLGGVAGVLFDKEPGAHRAHEGLRAHAAIEHLGDVLPRLGRMPTTEDRAIILLGQCLERAEDRGHLIGPVNIHLGAQDRLNGIDIHEARAHAL